MSEKIEVWPEPTPNPHSMKFNVNLHLVDEPVEIGSALEAERSPLASKLFGFPWTSGVYIGPNFITITKQDWVEWEMLAQPLAGLLHEHLTSGEPILVDRPDFDESTDDVNDDITDEDSPQVRKIKEIIRDEVRPAVRMDGGDIVFHSYENGKVYIYMKGACSGCPSSTITLKHGIETRIRELVPEVEEVIAL